jgi:DNA-binding Lrp family transcriptional regulator
MHNSSDISLNFFAFTALNLCATQYSMEIDAINFKILTELESDGRISNTELSERVGLSPSACLRRVQDLERRGIILGYRALLDRTKIGTGFTVFVMVGLSGHLRADAQSFETRMLASSAVRECHNITGAVEYLLRVEVADLAEYKTFHADILGTLSMVASITSYIALGSPKDRLA